MLISDDIPLVSVVIPTKGRPTQVFTAINSALAQSLPDLEVLVIVDGPDPETVAQVSAISDDRLKIHILPRSVGGADARNYGVQQALGVWVAFLDDDDEWFPEKLNKQIDCTRNSRSKWPIGSCRLIARRDGGDTMWPFRKPRFQENISEYLLCRSSLSHGEGVVQTSTIVAKRQFFELVPFASGLKRHHDWDWLLRAYCVDGASLEWVWEPLVIYNIESGRGSINRRVSWIESFDWAATNKHISPKAFSHFIAIQIAPRLNLWRDFKSVGQILLALRKKGSFDLRALALGILFASVPLSLLRKVSQTNVLSRVRSGRVIRLESSDN